MDILVKDILRQKKEILSNPYYSQFGELEALGRLSAFLNTDNRILPSLHTIDQVDDFISVLIDGVETYANKSVIVDRNKKYAEAKAILLDIHESAAELFSVLGQYQQMTRLINNDGVNICLLDTWSLLERACQESCTQCYKVDDIGFRYMADKYWPSPSSLVNAIGLEACSEVSNFERLAAKSKGDLIHAVFKSCSELLASIVDSSSRLIGHLESYQFLDSAGFSVVHFSSFWNLVYLAEKSSFDTSLEFLKWRRSLNEKKAVSSGREVILLPSPACLMGAIGNAVKPEREYIDDWLNKNVGRGKRIDPNPIHYLTAIWDDLNERDWGDLVSGQESLTNDSWASLVKIMLDLKQDFSGQNVVSAKNNYRNKTNI